MSRSVHRIESTRGFEHPFNYRVMHSWSTRPWLRPKLLSMARPERHYWNRWFNATTRSFGPLHRAPKKAEVGKDAVGVPVQRADRETDAIHFSLDV
jgi:hypothetical protein